MSFKATAGLSRASGQLSCDLNGEIAILNLDSKLYFGVADVAVFIWRLLEAPTDIVSVKRAVMQEFDVSAEQCSLDVDQFLSDLNDAGLLKVEAAPEVVGTAE